MVPVVRKIAYFGTAIGRANIIKNALTGVDNAQTAYPEIFPTSSAKVYIVWHEITRLLVKVFLLSFGIQQAEVR